MCVVVGGMVGWCVCSKQALPSANKQKLGWLSGRPRARKTSSMEAMDVQRKASLTGTTMAAGATSRQLGASACSRRPTMTGRRRAQQQGRRWQSHAVGAIYRRPFNPPTRRAAGLARASRPPFPPSPPPGQPLLYLASTSPTSVTMVEGPVAGEGAGLGSARVWGWACLSNGSGFLDRAGTTTIILIQMREKPTGDSCKQRFAMEPRATRPLAACAAATFVAGDEGSANRAPGVGLAVSSRAGPGAATSRRDSPRTTLKARPLGLLGGGYLGVPWNPRASAWARQVS